MPERQDVQGRTNAAGSLGLLPTRHSGSSPSQDAQESGGFRQPPIARRRLTYFGPNE
jgi:hypothetical protein